MIDISGASGRLKALYTYITTYMAAARMAKIDNCDTTTSSRAPAATAVSNADYTPARGALLSGIIQNTVIASIQTGYVANSGTTGATEDDRYLDVAITAVSATNKCLVIVQGYDSNSDNVILIATGRLTSTTNLRLTSPGTTVRGRWYVIEFK